VLSVFGPPVALGTASLLTRVRIDDQKVIPLALGPGVVGAIATGFIKWHTRTGGLPGATGKYALGHAAITPWWQVFGVLVAVGLAAIPCLLLCVIFERTTGLRVTNRQEVASLDQTYWRVSNFGDEQLPELEPDDSAIPEDGTDAARSNGVASATR
jgi:ammonia channel protein AmtB